MRYSHLINSIIKTSIILLVDPRSKIIWIAIIDAKAEHE